MEGKAGGEASEMGQRGQVPRSGTRLHWEIVLKRDQGMGWPGAWRDTGLGEIQSGTKEENSGKQDQVTAGLRRVAVVKLQMPGAEQVWQVVVYGVLDEEPRRCVERTWVLMPRWAERQPGWRQVWERLVDAERVQGPLERAGETVSGEAHSRLRLEAA